MKVLVITYYWPPAGGSGVQRWLKFVKYLPSFDIEPIVYTVENPKYAVNDNSLMEEVPESIEVIRESIWEPNSLIELFSGNKGKQSAGFLDPNPSLFGRFMQYIRANYFIPDARKFWIKPSVRKLKKYIIDHKIGAIITTGPPHSLHIIGSKLKETTGVKWIADFRDPWTNIDYFHNLPLTETARKKHHELEDMVLKSADVVVVVGSNMEKEFRSRSNKVVVISNGYDEEPEAGEVMLDEKFSISHIGMMNADRNPRILWLALKELIDESEEFSNDLRVKLIGQCDPAVYESVREHGLQNHTNYVSYVSHKDVIKFQRSSQLLLLSVNNVPSAKGVVTGKVFEYLQSKRPIIGIGPVDGDLSVILKETSSGEMVDFDDLITLKGIIKAQYDRYKSGNLLVESKNIEQYHRKNLTKELAKVLKEL